MAEDTGSSSSGDSGWGDWLAAAATVGGGLASNASSARQVRLQHAAQWGFQDDAQQFADYMSSSAHTREVRDLRKAGLNPILSGTGGMGSASPSAHGASGAAAPQQNVMTGAVSSAMEVRRNRAEIGLLNQKQQTEKGNTRTAENQADVSDFERRVVDAMRHNYKDSGVDVEAKRRIAGAKQSTTASDIERQLDESSGDFTRTLRRLGLDAGSAAQLIRSLRGAPAAPFRR